MSIESLPKPIFISYSRRDSRGHVDALVKLLGEDQCFVDRNDIEKYAEFPKEISTAMMAARHVIVFWSPNYPKSWYCWREWHMALAPFSAVRSGNRTTEWRAATAHLTIIIPSDLSGVDTHLLPPTLRNRDLFSVDDLGAVQVRLLSQNLATARTLDQLFAHFGVRDDMRDMLRATSILPAAPKKQSGVPTYPIAQHDRLRSLGNDFVGRAADFWALHDALAVGADSSAACLTASVTGGGGFGKTRLALEYFHRMGPLYYRGGNFWIDASGTGESIELDVQLEDLRKLLQKKLVQRLVAEGSPIPNAEYLSQSRCETLSEALQEVGKDPILYIVDNLPDTGDHGDLDTYCPAEKEVSLIFTSRRKVAWDNVTGLSLDVLDREDAIRMLQRGVQRHESLLSKQEWHDLAEAVGDLPLVLEILNKHIKLSAGDSRVLARRVIKADDSQIVEDMLDELKAIVPIGAVRGINKAFREVFDVLSTEEQSLLLRLGWLAPSQVPHDLCSRLSSDLHTQGDLTVRLALASWLMAEDSAGSAAKTFKMHRVIAAFLRGLQQSSDSAHGVFSRVSSALHDHLNELKEQRPTLDTLAMLRPHVDAMISRDGSWDDQSLWRRDWKSRELWEEAVDNAADGPLELYPTPAQLCSRRQWWSLLESTRLGDLAIEWQQAGISVEDIQVGLLDYARVRPGDQAVAGQVLWALEHLQLAKGSTGKPPARLLSPSEYTTFFTELGYPSPPISPESVMDLILCPPHGEQGVFVMGSAEGEAAFTDEGPAHEVQLSPFLFGKTPVTWKQWRQFAPHWPLPDGDTDAHPARGIDWWSAFLFARWCGGDLPTEAQWEFAARAGTQGQFSFSGGEEELLDRGWFFRNSGNQVLPAGTEWDLQRVRFEWGCRPQPVGQKLPNPWGFLDIHGNVWEWCRDWYAGGYPPQTGAASLDPDGPIGVRFRVLRGGCYGDGAVGCRSAARSGDDPSSRDVFIGFRVAFPVPPSS